MSAQPLKMKEAIDHLVEFGDGFEVALMNQLENRDRKLLLPSMTELLVARLELSSVQDGKVTLTRDQVLCALFSFGT